MVSKFIVFGCFTNYKGNEVRNAQQPRLINKMNPVTIIHPARIYDKPSWLPTSSPGCKPPKQRIFQQDELSLYKGSSTVKSFEEIGESLLQFLDSDYKCFLYDKHCLLQKCSTNCQYHKLRSVLILIFMTSCFTIPLPDWFTKTSECKFKSKDVAKLSYLHSTRKWTMG